MELWIRKQNKRAIIKAAEIHIDNLYYENGDVDLYANGFQLGRYTEKRALEILDEIQKLMRPRIIIKRGEIVGSNLDGTLCTTPGECEIHDIPIIVYEMPEK